MGMFCSVQGISELLLLPTRLNSKVGSSIDFLVYTGRLSGFECLHVIVRCTTYGVTFSIR